MKLIANTKWVILFLSFGALVFFPTRVADACGRVPEDRAYTFIERVMVDTTSIYTPYALSFADFNFGFLKKEKQKQEQEQEQVQVQEQVNQNVKEWQSRYCDQALAEDVFQVIYKTSVEELEELRAATINPNVPLPIDLRGNTFAEANQRMKCTEVIDYLIFAKKCEPHVVVGGDLWNPQKRDMNAVHELMKEGGKLFKHTDSYFIRLRTAYQVIRLAHYAKEYKKVLELRDYFLPKIDKVDSIINWWILGHVAGAELKLGHKVKAAYSFAQIFQNCPSKRTSAYESFHIDNDQEWGQALLMCQSNDEKANLYAIRASQPKSRLLDEMEAIYRLNPQHSSLEPLLVKAVKQMEYIFLGAEFHQNAQGKPPTKNQRKRLDLLQKFVEKVAQEKQAAHSIIWEIANGYLLYLQGNWPEAEMIFNSLPTEDPALIEQIETIKTVIRINSYQHADTEAESDLYNLMTSSEVYKKNRALRLFLKNRLAYLYKIDSLPGKSLLVTYSVDDLKYNPDLAILDELIQLSEKENPTRLEKTLIYRRDSTIRSELLEIKATLLLSQGQVEAAKETYSYVPRNDRSTKVFSPFAEDFRDCVFCPQTDTTAYTKADLIEKLVEYDYRARADITSGPDYFYLLGSAWYNMSYFGPSWEAMDYFRSGDNWYYSFDDVYPTSKSPFGNRENHNLTKAKVYFNKALELAKDRELQARAAFMLARIDQKEYFLSENCKYSPSQNLIPKLPPDKMVFYNLLIREYNDTKFYNEIIEECRFFAAYAR